MEDRLTLTRNTVGQNIRYARIKAGVKSQSELIRKIKNNGGHTLSPGKLSEIERGLCSASEPDLNAISVALGVAKESLRAWSHREQELIDCIESCLLKGGDFVAAEQWTKELVSIVDQGRLPFVTHLQGRVFIALGKYGYALDCFKMVADEASKMGNRELSYKSIKNIAIALYYLQNYFDSLEMSSDALSFAKTEFERMEILQLQAILRSELRDFAGSLQLHEQVLDFYIRNEFEINIIQTLHSMGDAYLKQNLLGEAMNKFREANNLAILMKQCSERSTAISRTTFEIANIHYHKGNKAEAKKLLFDLLEIERIPPRQLIQAKLLLSKCTDDQNIKKSLLESADSMIENGFDDRKIAAELWYELALVYQNGTIEEKEKSFLLLRKSCGVLLKRGD